MKRRKIACLCMALIITTLLTGCGLKDIPGVGKLFNKDNNTQTEAPDNQNVTDITDGSPSVDAEYPAVPVGAVITAADIFDVLSSAGLSTDTVDAYLILDSNDQDVNELTITEDTWFTFIYHLRGTEDGEQSRMVIGVKVTDEVAEPVSEPQDDITDQQDVSDVSDENNNRPAVAKYEVFDYNAAVSETFDFSSLDSGKLYLNSVSNFDVHAVPHNWEYDSMAKSMTTMINQYEDVETSISSKFDVYCVPKSYVYMQASDYEEGADMSAYNGEYVLVLEPKYDSYTDSIYRREETLILPLIDDVNALAKEPSDEAKQECQFLLSEEFDDESTDIQDLYGAMEVLMQLANTEDIFIFDDVFKVIVIDYCDMGTPDNMSDDIPWDEYESGILNGEQSSNESNTEGSSEEIVGGTTVITETTTTTTTESVISAINKEVANSFRSRHPELFSFFPDTDQVYSKWDWRIDDDTTVKGTVTLKDGTIIPSLSEGGRTYNIFDGSSAEPSTSSDDGVFGRFTSTDPVDDIPEDDDGSMTMGDEGYDTSEPEEDEENKLNEYTISLGNTTCKVVANNTYRYMLDNQNSSSNEVYVNHRDRRYTIKVVNESEFMQYRTKDNLSRGIVNYSIVDSNYIGATDVGNNSIILTNIKYNSGGQEITEPHMAYIRNGTEYIVIIPSEAENAGSDTLADILKRCVSMQ